MLGGPLRPAGFGGQAGHWLLVAFKQKEPGKIICRALIFYVSNRLLFFF